MSILIPMVRMWLTRSGQPFIFSGRYDTSLQYEDTENLGLYVHIPFCRSLCEFCPYCKVVYEQELAKDYIKALLKEIDMVGSSTGNQRKDVTSLYFGGGSPALLAEYIGSIINRIKKYYNIKEGVGLELHPLDVTVPRLQMLKAAGVTKISIGIQSFQPEFLELLGRQEADYKVMFEALSQVHFETVSMDFIFALPGQSIDHIKKDIETAFSNHANHVAIYPFIDFTYTSHSFIRMNSKEKKALFYQIISYCENAGYIRDSIWTFSKNGKAKYSSMTRDNFLGFGCSATTLLMSSFKINTFDVKEYMGRIENGLLSTALTLRYTLRQRMVYYLFWTFYSLRLSEKKFELFFSKKLSRYYGSELLLARMLGLLKKTGDEYRMTAKGSYFYHYFEHFYTLSYIDQMWSLMRKTPFPKELIIR